MDQTTSSKLLDEPGRLAALARYQVMDTAPEGAFDKITALVKMVFQAPMVAVSLLDCSRQWFKSKQGLSVCETVRDIAFCSATVLSPDPLLVPDARRDPRFRNNPLVIGPPFIASYLGIPLRTPDGYNLGALCVLDIVPRHYEGQQIEILKGFAELVENELELRMIAQADHLTGILSRRAFLGEVGRAMAISQRYRRPSTLVTFDIDHFKRVNDSHGHQAGDRVLRAVSEACRWAMRETELFGRIGGEEFGILLPETNLEQGRKAAERFRTVIEDLSVPHEPPLQVTASFGLAELTDAWKDAESWLAATDVALYAAKQGGRNRCEIWREASL